MNKHIQSEEDDNIMNQWKKEPWKIVLGIISILFILLMWIKKDIVGIYSTMPKEQLIPMIATTVMVSLSKVAGIAAVVFLIKWVASKFTKQNKQPRKEELKLLYSTSLNPTTVEWRGEGTEIAASQYG